MSRVGRDIAEATGLSGPDFGVLSRLVDLGQGAMRQQVLAESMGWDKSRLSHQLTRMQEKGLVERRDAEKTDRHGDDHEDRSTKDRFCKTDPCGVCSGKPAFPAHSGAGGHDGARE